MAKTFQDENWLVWEAFASAGDFGYSTRPHIVFHCVTDRSLRPRYCEQEGDKADAERVVASASPNELLELLHRAQPVD
ncbi:MAG: hypothetical protein HY561_06185 [Gemmatimonadetes bacterium]|nr:hypothetical protein [Gemmatimonadota bacterium]